MIRLPTLLTLLLGKESSIVYYRVAVNLAILS
nr:MAG TPA: hypothetical protein [Caudoviricetes sp.]